MDSLSFLVWFRKLQLIFRILFGGGVVCKHCGGIACIGVVFFNDKYHVKYFCHGCYDVNLGVAYHRYVLMDPDWRGRVHRIKELRHKDNFGVDLDFIDRLGEE